MFETQVWVGAWHSAQFVGPHLAILPSVTKNSINKDEPDAYEYASFLDWLIYKYTYYSEHASN